MIYLSMNQIIEVHDDILATTGGLPGVRDLYVLESAAFAPQVSLFGVDMYFTIAEKAAVYLYHLVKNHPFNDGNKRTAVACTLIFMELNGMSLPDEYDLEGVTISVADGMLSKEQLIKLFMKHHPLI